MKRFLNISSATKMIKKVHLHVYSSQKIHVYRRNFDETKYISFLIKDDELLEKYDEIWKKKLRIVFKKNLIVNPVTMKNF